MRWGRRPAGSGEGQAVEPTRVVGTVLDEDAVGRLLRAARDELGISRTCAAQLSGIPAARIAAYEQGRVVDPAPLELRRLAETLTISPRELERALSQQASEL